MPSDTKNVKLGVCQILYGGYDLGYTKGGVDVEVKTESKKVMVDQFGQSEINEIIMGRTISAKVPLAESVINNLSKVIAGSTLKLSGGAAAMASITVGAVPAGATNMAVNGYTFTFRANTNAVLISEIGITGLTTAQAAQKIADAINSSTDSRLVDISASVSGNVVTLQANTLGTGPNAYTLSAGTSGLTVSGATFTGGAAPGPQRLDVGNGTSVSLLSLAKMLVLHPIALPDTDRSQDLVIPLAGCAGDMTLAYKLDEERIYTMTFNGYPNAATGELYVAGDVTIPG